MSSDKDLASRSELIVVTSDEIRIGPGVEE
jgi:hypothetical protein